MVEALPKLYSVYKITSHLRSGKAKPKIHGLLINLQYNNLTCRDCVIANNDF